MATWPAGIIIGDSRIAAGEPITEDLMTDYRDRDDYCLDYIQASVGYQNWVAQGHLKSTTQEVTLVNGSYTGIQGWLNVSLEITAPLAAYSTYISMWSGPAGSDPGHQDFTLTALASVGSYGFWPQVKNPAGTFNTLYARFRYVQASRDYPVAWIARRKSDGEIISSVFDPEACGYGHPFVRLPKRIDVADVEIICLELARSDALRQRLFADYGRAGSFLMQIHQMLASGAVDLLGGAEPLLPDMSPAQREKLAELGLDHSSDVSRTGSAPALYDPRATVLDFKFRPELIEVVHD